MRKKNNSDYCSTKLNWILILISVIVFTVIMLVVMYVPELRSWDMSFLDTLQAILAAFPISIAYAVTDFGRHNYMLWPQITVASVLISHKKYFKTFLFLLIMQFSFRILGFLKPFVHRDRPIIHPEYSFPSGHADTTMCLYGICIYLIHVYVTNKYWKYFLITVFSLFIFMVCLSRLWIRVHFLTDIIAGTFLGLFFVNVYIIICKFMKM